jgi:pyruvate dehydrogenase E2 component (dihydrolipoamide acetyltransferase)
MAVEVVVPEVGEIGMEVTFVTWYRADGDHVEAGQPLFQVDTQKTLFDVEALATGTLTGLAAAPGDLVEARQVIARIVTADERGESLATPLEVAPPDVAAPAARTSSEPGSSATPSTTAEASRARRAAASPRARRLAGRLGLDLEGLAGTGPDGLITEADVQRAAESPATTVPSGAPPPQPATSDRSTRVRRAVADLTTRSWQQVPHFFVRIEADLTDGLERSKPLPLVMAALAQALRARPECNVEWRADGTVAQRTTVDLGLLVDTPDGLLLPAIRDVDRLSPAELAEAITAAAGRARAGRLHADDFATRSASVSNLGMFAIDEFAGIVAAPDTLLLSIGRATVRPRWDGSAFVPRTVATLTLSVDHRVLDGADAGRLADEIEARLRGGAADGSEP